MPDGLREEVDVYPGADDPFVFDWGGVRFRIHRGDPPADQPRVDPGGPAQSFPAQPSGHGVLIYPDDGPFVYPERSKLDIPERVGVISDLDSVYAAVSERIAGAEMPCRIRVEATVRGTDLRPVLEGLTGVVADTTDVFVVGRSESVSD